jgi:hypothetical protein
MRPFLPERFDTIFGQASQDGELFVYDSHSDDGSWEYIQGLAARGTPETAICHLAGYHTGPGRCLCRRPKPIAI